MQGEKTVDGQLSRNEQLVLYGLTKYPALTDNEICKSLEMKPSTFSTIKKSLEERGHFRVSYDPLMQHLGCELLAMSYVRLNRKTKAEDRLEITRDELMAAEDIFILLTESNQAIAMSISRNIAEHVKTFDRFVQLYESYDFLEEALHTVMFPFEQSYVFSFFDFSPMLNRFFKIEPVSENLPEIDIDSPKIRTHVTHREFSLLEKKVFLGLIRFPELSDATLGEKLGCSRHMIRRLRARFLEEKLIKRRVVVSMEKLGFEILAMMHFKFNALKPVRDRQMCIRRIAMLHTPIFYIARDPESVMLIPFKNFEEFQRIHETVSTFMAEKDVLKGEPITYLLSLPRLTELKWLLYEPLVKKILDIK